MINFAVNKKNGVFTYTTENNLSIYLFIATLNDDNKAIVNIKVSEHKRCVQ